MNLFLWILQALLALHTAMGAVWKFSNPAQNMPSLKAIPNQAWLGLSVVEFACAALLVLPAVYKPSSGLVSVAALIIAGEMLLYTVLHLISKSSEHGQIVYWLVVAAVCGFIAYGRRTLN